MNAFYSLRKITRPGLPPVILHRKSLVAALNEAITGRSADNSAGYNLVLLCAPAGYGKTTLLADFARRTTIPCCWYFLDSSDTDKRTFAELLIISIRQCFPQFGAELEAQLANSIFADAPRSADPRAFETLVDSLISAIETDIPEKFAFFLCNYHEVNSNQDISVLINRFLHHLPPQCAVVIESRAVPSLELATLLARRQVFGIGSNGLRFTAQDIHDLARLQCIESFSYEEARYLSESFDGWIAGILLGTRLGDVQFLASDMDSKTGWGSPAMRMDRQNLFEYLVKEIFNREPELYAFLKDVSVLQQMIPGICNALLTITDAETRLAYLEHQGLFVTHNGDGPEITYTCYPVFRELLYAELHNENAERFVYLHHRAANLFHAVKDYDQAIFHALAAGADEFAASLIIEVSKQMLSRGYSETIARWIDSLPAPTLEHYPRLQLLRANIHLMKYETARALPLLDKVQFLIVRESAGVSDDLFPTMLAEIFLAQTVVLLEAGEYSQSVDLCQQALALLPSAERELRATALQRLGICASLLGDCATGISQMQKALQLWENSTEIRQTSLVHGHLANAYNMIGNYALSEHHRARAISGCDCIGDTWGKINNLIGIATTKRHRGSLGEAELTLKQALELARDTHFRSGEAYALVNLGEIHQDQGLYEKALAVTEDGLVLARQVGDNYLTNSTLCVLAMNYLLMGDPHTALLLLDEVNVKTSDTVSYEGILLDLTRGTIFLFQRDYSNATRYLTAAEARSNEAGLKRLLLRILIRLAACHLAQGKMEEATSCMEKAVALTMQGNHKHIAMIELQRLPELWQAVQTMPETACLEAWRSQNTKMLEECAPQQQSAHISTGRSASRLRVLALGEPAILIDDIPVTHWRMPRSMELYFFLLNCNSPMRKEQIIVALWRDAGDHIDQILRSTIYYLRKALRENCIVYSSGTYTLNLASLYGEQVWYDVAAFQERYTEAKEALAAENDVVAESALQDMVNMYRGDYVQSFYSDWCIMPRDEFRRTYVDARRQLAHIAWNREQFDGSIVHWQHMLAIDNCLEDAHYGLMRCYLRQGKRALAIRQYQHCVAVLKEELSVTPGPSIRKLYQRLTGNS